MRENIKIGDPVLLANGMFGKVVDITAECYVIEFGTNRGVRIPVIKQEVYAKKEPNLSNKPEEEPVPEKKPLFGSKKKDEENKKDDIFKHGNTLYVAGAISDKLLQFLRQQKQIREITLIMRDFTKMFASMETYYAFVKKGGTIQVLQKSKLLAVCINPQSPDGYCLDSDELRVAMQTSLGIPVYDVKRIEN